jgi:Rv0078B-related antitoxin
VKGSGDRLCHAPETSPASTVRGSSRVRESVGLRANIYLMPHTDTSPAAQAVQLEILRVMSGEQRILLALEMNLFARELAKEGIRREHPDWSEASVAREMLRLAFFPAPLPTWIP